MGDYQFSRTSKSVVRLNYMHELVKQICGFLIEPRIPTSGPLLRVADIGAGTGIWALQALAQLPDDAVVTAFDNAEEQFFPRGQLPNRVEIRILDAFQPFPREYHGYFDMINIKFWKTLVNADNIGVFVDNIMQILKPGGYIQWLEFETGASELRKGSPDLATPYIEKMKAMSHKPDGSPSWNWVSSQALFEAAGLTDVDTVRIKWSPERFLPFVMHFYYLTLGDKLDQMQRDRLVDAAKPLQELYDHLPFEFGMGSGLVQDFILLIGKRSPS